MKQSTKNVLAQIIIEKIKFMDSSIDYVDVSWGEYDSDIQAIIVDTMKSNKLHPTKSALIEMQELIFQRMESQYIIKQFQKTYQTCKISVSYPDPKHIRVEVMRSDDEVGFDYDFHVPNQSTYNYVFEADEFPAIIFPII